MPANPIIKTKNLSVTYFMGKSNEVKALADANVEIYPGEFIIFFGPSGCGKSTLLYAIAGLERHIQGDVFVEDKNLAHFSNKELEKYHQDKMGIIFQAFYLIGSLSVLKNVTLPQISLGIQTKERETKAQKLLEHFGVAPQAYKLPTELSGGQQQRVAICRSLINNPGIVLADEPTGNLDSKSAGDVMDLLRELNLKQKKTVILVTHSPANLNYAHRVFYMKDGRITDVKVNKPIELEGKKVVSEGVPAEAKPKIQKDMELLSKTFTSFTSDKLGNMLIPFKAQQIVSEALTGMSVEEVDVLEKKVEELLKNGMKNSDEIMKYLDEDESEGGLAMSKQAAKNLADRVIDIVKEIKDLEEEEKKQSKISNYDDDDEVRSIREYLFDIFNINVRSVEAIKNFNLIIKTRLENKISRKTVFKFLDLPLKKKGVGLDKRDARKVAKRLELLVLGKYNPNRKFRRPGSKNEPKPPQIKALPPKPPSTVQGASQTKEDSKVFFIKLIEKIKSLFNKKEKIQVQENTKNIKEDNISQELQTEQPEEKLNIEEDTKIENKLLKFNKKSEKGKINFNIFKPFIAFGKKIKNSFDIIIRGIKKLISNISRNVKFVLKRFGITVKNHVKNTSEKVKNGSKKAKNSAVNGVKKTSKNIKEGSKKIKNHVLSGIKKTKINTKEIVEESLKKYLENQDKKMIEKQGKKIIKKLNLHKKDRKKEK